MADRVPGIRRVRFTTSHPGHLKQAIMDCFRDVPTVCNHLHLPVQSGCDRILHAMNRGYTRARYISKIDALKKSVPGMAFSTDLIVGFPGETAAEFGETLQLMREVEFDQRVKEIASKYEGKLSFKYTGPWPPYNFVHIRLKLERGEGTTEAVAS